MGPQKRDRWPRSCGRHRQREPGRVRGMLRPRPRIFFLGEGVREEFYREPTRIGRGAQCRGHGAPVHHDCGWTRADLSGENLFCRARLLYSKYSGRLASAFLYWHMHMEGCRAIVLLVLLVFWVYVTPEDTCNPVWTVSRVLIG